MQITVSKMQSKISVAPLASTQIYILKLKVLKKFRPHDLFNVDSPGKETKNVITIVVKVCFCFLRQTNLNC